MGYYLDMQVKNEDVRYVTSHDYQIYEFSMG